MDEQEIRKVIAEFMGWHDFIMGAEVWCAFKPNRKEVFRFAIPRYTEDLNLMREVEERLHDADGNTGWHPYILALMDLVDGGGGAEFGEIDAVYRVAHATAEQRARAAYQVISQKEG